MFGHSRSPKILIALKTCFLTFSFLLALLFSMSCGSSNSPSTSPTLGSRSSDRPSGPIYTITFDDGWKSAYEVGLPIIEASGYKMTQFIITGPIGHDSSRMTAAQILAAQKRGHEIGSHTRTHPRLTTLTPHQQQDEIFKGYRDLCSLLSHCPTSFAYPYGAYDDSIASIVKSTGFTSARIGGDYADGSTIKHPVNAAPVNRYVLASYAITSATTLEDLKSLIDSTQGKNVWLIFALHRVDEPESDLSIKHELLQEMMTYLREKKATVVTQSQGAAILGPSGTP